MNRKKTQIDKFMEYCKERKLSIAIIYLFVFAVYGAWAFQDFVSFDAEGFYSKETGIIWYTQWLELGRWAFCILKKILGVEVINPFFSITVFLICFPFSSVMWSYLFHLWGGFSSKVSSKYDIVIFGVIFLVHPIWTLQYAYRNQIEVFCIIMVLLPVSMLAFTKWMEEKKVIYGVISMMGIVFCFSGYQSFIIVYIEAIAIYFLLYIMKVQCSEAIEKEFFNRLIRVAVYSIVAFVLYQLIFRLVCKFFLEDALAYDSYLSSVTKWKTESTLTCINNIVEFLKMSIAGDGKVYNCLFLIEIIVLCVITIHTFFQKKKLKIWQALVNIGVVLIPFLIVFVSADKYMVSRSQLAVVLAIAFLGKYELNYICDILGKKVSKGCKQAVMIIILLCIVFPQMQMNTRLLYSDYKVLYNDYEMMSRIYNLALYKGANEGDAIVFIGERSNITDETVVEYEVIGFSYFEVTSLDPMKCIEAMQGYGFSVRQPSESEMQYAEGRKDSIPCWPSSDSVVVENGIIIVRLS